MKEKNHLRYKTINISKSQWDFTSKKVPNKILINSDLLRLFGYFLSEGHVQDRPSRTFISFTLNIKENEIVNDIRKISKFFFNLDVAIRRLPERKTVVVDLYSARLARFFKEMFKNGAENKIIPDFIMNHFYVYILKRIILNTHYYGHTSNLEKRISDHNLGLSNFTKKYIPWELIYFEEFPTRSEAMKREKVL